MYRRSRIEVTINKPKLNVSLSQTKKILTVGTLVAVSVVAPLSKQGVKLFKKLQTNNSNNSNTKSNRLNKSPLIRLSYSDNNTEVTQLLSTKTKVTSLPSNFTEEQMYSFVNELVRKINQDTHHTFKQDIVKLKTVTTLYINQVTTQVAENISNIQLSKVQFKLTAMKQDLKDLVNYIEDTCSRYIDSFDKVYEVYKVVEYLEALVEEQG